MTDSDVKFALLPIESITSGENVRVDLRDLDDLADSIRQRGMLQPLVVVPSVAGDGAELLIGHRRFAAAKRAGLERVPCLLKTRGPVKSRVLDQLAENLSRSDMTVLEKALAYEQLAESGMTNLQIGQSVQRSDEWVKRTRNLLLMPECVQRAAHEGVIGATRALDIPLSYFDNEGAAERLEVLLESEGGDGLHTWYRGEYAWESKKEKAAHPTPTAPVLSAIERESEEKRTKAAAWRAAVSIVLERHYDEITREYEAILEAGSEVLP